ncbi:MAG: hypothetical protein ACF8NJ_05910 [Phycisphaerales bacterium JB038]
MDYALSLPGNHEIEAESKVEFEEWRDLHRRLLGRKQARDLKVLFLCGPEPLNDLGVLLEAGVNPHNVWAIESDRTEFGRAIVQLLDSGLPVKAYPGDLGGFLEVSGEAFDIIYFDGCSPIGSGRPNSLSALLQLFKHQRLAPLGALITTFAGLDDTLLDQYSEILAAYFRFRYNDLPDALFASGLDPAECQYDDSLLIEAIRRDSEPYYSDFITRFMVDLTRSLVPNCRAFAFAGVERSYLSNTDERRAALTAASRNPWKPGMSISDLFLEIGDFLRNPSSYPVLSFLRTLGDRSSDTRLWRQLDQVRLGSRSLLEGAQYAAMLERCTEGHWQAVGGVLLDALRLGWFDDRIRISCDVPMPNLKVNSFLGIHGAPAFPNPPLCQRFRYVAKQTTMYTDLLVLDRCRSYFDWFPTVHVAKTRFRSRGFQLVARSIMDRMGWADWHSGSHPFTGAAMAGMGATKHSKAVTFGRRIVIG